MQFFFRALCLCAHYPFLSWASPHHCARFWSRLFFAVLSENAKKICRFHATTHSSVSENLHNKDIVLCSAMGVHVSAVRSVFNDFVFSCSKSLLKNCSHRNTTTVTRLYWCVPSTVQLVCLIPDAAVQVCGVIELPCWEYACCGAKGVCGRQRAEPPTWHSNTTDKTWHRSSPDASVNRCRCQHHNIIGDSCEAVRWRQETSSLADMRTCALQDCSWCENGVCVPDTYTGDPGKKSSP